MSHVFDIRISKYTLCHPLLSWSPFNVLYFHLSIGFTVCAPLRHHWVSSSKMSLSGVFGDLLGFIFFLGQTTKFSLWDMRYNFSDTRPFSLSSIRSWYQILTTPTWTWFVTCMSSILHRQLPPQMSYTTTYFTSDSLSLFLLRFQICKRS